jgi:hypothetical protein
VLSGQHHRTNWQDICFKNPGAPFCQGHDFAVKKTPPSKKGGSVGEASGEDSSESTPEEAATPSVIVVGGIDWRFADPLADALAGFNFSGFTNSAVARGLIAQLGAHQGLTEAEIQTIFNRLCGVDRVAISVRGDSILLLVTGVAGLTVPPMETGWKVATVSHNAMLIGPAEVVDQAVQRIGMKAPASEWANLVEQWQSSSEYWAAGSGGFLGPAAAAAGVKRFSLALSMRNRVTSEVEFDFSAAAGSDVLRLWPMPGDLAGNAFHARTSIPADEVQQRFGQIAGSPLGQRLASLLKVARYLPARDTAAPIPSKPVIYGLDNGPKVVK